ncbi:MAG TPA: type II toxin-antitoxin system VapC family toxin [Rugosimonospora sp.]|nr:type II toxin-antitoxin system VapC family toxin [Rugosimonospora sp.]
MIYLDSGALVKLVMPAPESAALGGYLRAHADVRHVASALVRAEIRRALRRSGATTRQQHTAEKLLATVITISVTDELLDAAGNLDDPGLRSLDAIHLATARSLGAGLTGFVTYDHRLLAAARAAGLPTAAPTGKA